MRKFKNILGEYNKKLETRMEMHCSFSSHLKQIGAVSLLALLTACGAGSDSGDANTAGTPKMLASVVVASAAPLAPATIRMHYHRAQNDANQWGIYSWDGPVTP